jgi:hypothetical protein
LTVKTVVSNFLQSVHRTCARPVNYLRHRLSGTNTEPDEDSNTTEEVEEIPPLELSKEMKTAIMTGAMKAKLLFDTYHWEWAEGGVPTAMKIVETYTKMVNDVWEQAMEIEDGEMAGLGSVMTGRLTCEYGDNHWQFGILLATAFDDTGDEAANEEKPKIANSKELGDT